MPQLPFKIGQIYKRSEIHHKFGGSGWGGISPSAKQPYIFIFSGKSGEQYGYKDEWINENVFAFTGEGQFGDMQFIKGNLSILNHLSTGYRVFLFNTDVKAYARFEDELKYDGFKYFKAKDKDGYKRRAIRFFLKRVDTDVPFPDKSSFSINIPNETERKGLITSRVGQGIYRDSILIRWQYKCAVTGFHKKEILIASHIVSWKESTNKERLDVNNGILLSPVYDALFDRHLISFGNNGKIIISKRLTKSPYFTLGVTGKERINDLSDLNVPFLERHREHLNEKEKK